MRLPSRIGTMSLRSTTAIDCSSRSSAFRWATSSGFEPPRPCPGEPGLAAIASAATILTTVTLFRMCASVSVLLVPQRDERIDARGAPRRHVAREPRDYCEDSGHDRERHGVAPADAEQQSAD